MGFEVYDVVASLCSDSRDPSHLVSQQSQHFGSEEDLYASLYRNPVQERNDASPLALYPSAGVGQTDALSQPLAVLNEVLQVDPDQCRINPAPALGHVP